jgi:hypothetical protein
VSRDFSQGYKDGAYFGKHRVYKEYDDYEVRSVDMKPVTDMGQPLPPSHISGLCSVFHS